MQVRSGFIDSIGNTPLIKLRAASAATGCEIYGKAEFLNPGGSVKDRAALAMIRDAEQRGTLRKGGVVVEGTAGNTGIGIALVANARGYQWLAFRFGTYGLQETAWMAKRKSCSGNRKRSSKKSGD